MLVAYFVVPLLIGYSLGSIPIGYLLGRLHGVDLRQCGSGSTGATNVLRHVGKRAAILTLLGDFGKGVAAPLLTNFVIHFLPIAHADSLQVFGLPSSDLIALPITLSCFFVLLGHAKSIWIGFQGGKSVAAGVGTLFALDWRVGLAAALVWGLVAMVTRYSSLSSLLAVSSSPLFMWIFRHWLSQETTVANTYLYVVYCLCGAIYISYKHRSNISRLYRGEEPRLGERREGTANN